MFRDGTSVDFQSFAHLSGGDKWVRCDKGKDRVFGFLSTFSVSCPPFDEACGAKYEENC